MTGREGREDEFSAIYLKGIVDLIREYDKKSIIHYHGNIYKVLQGMKDIGMDGIHTIEAPPTGDCTILPRQEKSSVSIQF